MGSKTIKLTVKMPIHRREQIEIEEAEILRLKDYSFMVPRNDGMETVSGTFLKLLNGEKYEAFDLYDDVLELLDDVEFIQCVTYEQERIAFARSWIRDHKERNGMVMGVMLKYIWVKLVDGKEYQISGDYSRFVKLLSN